MGPFDQRPVVAVSRTVRRIAGLEGPVADKISRGLACGEQRETEKAGGCPTPRTLMRPTAKKEVRPHMHEADLDQTFDCSFLMAQRSEPNALPL
jgi:hypothetical protein